MGILEKFKIGFKKSASTFTSGLRDIIVKKEIDDKTLDQVENFLIESDVGVTSASEIKKIISTEKIDPKNETLAEVNLILKNYIIELMKPLEKDSFFNKIEKLKIILVSGVKIDTAGRLQNKKNLMDEYKKIANVAKKIDKEAPHEVILILDATSGQNVLNQVEEFNKIIPVTGLIMTKLDSTAKGGILIAVAKKYKLPIIALGLGEKEDDLQIFDAEKFANAFIQS